MQEVYEEGSIPSVTPLVDLGIPALLGTLLTQPGLGEGNFQATSAGLLNETADGFLDNPPTPTYEVNPLPWLLGDANSNGVVSADDYASVQSNFGDAGDPGILGDANLDGAVSADDYASVQANFGATSGMGMGGETTVPEPATLSLLAPGGLAMLRWRQ